MVALAPKEKPRKILPSSKANTASRTLIGLLIKLHLFYELNLARKIGKLDLRYSVLIRYFLKKGGNV